MTIDLTSWPILAVGGAVAGLVIATATSRPSRSFAAPTAAATAAILGGTAIGFAAALAADDAAIAAAGLGWCLMLLAILDAERFWLPSAVTLPLAAAGLAATAVLDPLALLDHVAGAAIGFASLAGVAALYARWRRRVGLGGGDAKLFAASGAWLGWAELPLVLAAASIAGLAVAAVVTRGRLRATMRLPFGIFLAAATWAVYLARASGR